MENNFIDSWRSLNDLSKPGFTWPGHESYGPTQRIDYIYYKIHKNVLLNNIIKIDKHNQDYYPGDHSLLIADFTFDPKNIDNYLSNLCNVEDHCLDSKLAKKRILFCK